MKKNYIFLSFLPIALVSLSGCKNNNPTDYSLTYKEGFKILYMTDTQIIDSNQDRNARLSQSEISQYSPNNMEELCFRYMDSLVEQTHPDLILLGGDNVYGEFDDSVSSLKALFNRLNSYKTPFSLVYGNHDNESEIGRSEQNKIIKKSKYAMYEDGLATIGLYSKKNKLLRNIMMLDSNGCSNASYQSEDDGVSRHSKLTESQIEKINKLKETIGNESDNPVPTTFVQHIAPYEIWEFYNARNISIPYTSNQEDEFGALNENSSVTEEYFMKYYQRFNTDNVLFGHDHVNNLSIVENGIRFTYLTKTSKYDYYNEDMLGGTLQTITNEGKTVSTEHIYVR